MGSRPLEGKVALITGSAGGIGTEVAKRYAHLGACPVLADMDYRRLENVRAQLGPKIDCRVLKCDLGRHRECIEFAQNSVRWKGRLKFFVSCAALYKRVLDKDSVVLHGFSRRPHRDRTCWVRISIQAAIGS